MSVYALSDIHGFKSIYDQVKEFLEPEDQVIFLGDAADRGPHGWQCIKAILDDPQFIYLLGNHDLFLVRRFFGPDEQYNARLHEHNGGATTLADMEGEDGKTIISYLKKLASCAYSANCVNDEGKHIYLSHSGAVSLEGDAVLDPEAFTWDREHFYKDAPEEIDLIVHGHTPIPYLISKLNEYSVLTQDDMIDGSKEFVPGQPFYYANWTKCNIDNCTIKSGAATLLNLDTLEATAFFVQGEEKDFLWRN